MGRRLRARPPARDSAAMLAGADEHATQLGIRPQTSMSGPFSMADETVYHAMYLAWQKRLQDGVARDTTPRSPR